MALLQHRRNQTNLHLAVWNPARILVCQSPDASSRYTRLKLVREVHGKRVLRFEDTDHASRAPTVPTHKPTQEPKLMLLCLIVGILSTRRNKPTCKSLHCF